MFDDDDPLEARLAILELMKVIDGEVSYTPKRTDGTQPDNISKLRKYKETQNKKVPQHGCHALSKAAQRFLYGIQCTWHFGGSAVQLSIPRRRGTHNQGSIWPA